MNSPESKPQGSEQPECTCIPSGDGGLPLYSPNCKVHNPVDLPNPSADEEVVQGIAEKWITVAGDAEMITDEHFKSAIREYATRLSQQHNAEREAEYHRGRSHELTEGDWVNRVEALQSELATAQKMVEELKAKKMSEVTPALIMDYASVQAERDSLRSKLQTAMEERDQWKCSAQLYHEELRRLADGRKVETNLAHPVEEKIATANSRLEEAHSVSKSLFKDHLALQAHVKACHAALQRISDVGCVDVRAAHMAAECLSSQPDPGLVEEVVKALEFARDEIGYAGNKVICDALTRLTRLSKPNDP